MFVGSTPRWGPSFNTPDLSSRKCATTMWTGASSVMTAHKRVSVSMLFHNNRTWNMRIIPQKDPLTDSLDSFVRFVSGFAT